MGTGYRAVIGHLSLVTGIAFSVLFLLGHWTFLYIDTLRLSSSPLAGEDCGEGESERCWILDISVFFLPKGDSRSF
jgi:hypothetical protein